MKDWRWAKKIVEVPGFEPGAFRMQSERDTTTPHPQAYLPFVYWQLSTGLGTQAVFYLYNLSHSVTKDSLSLRISEALTKWQLLN